MYKKEDIVKGVVTGIEGYGIFVKLEDGTSGLIHISEVSDFFVKNINDYVKINEEIFCRVLDVNNDTNQLRLSIKNINYKKDNGPVKETRLGFYPLKEKLPEWIETKMKEYK